MGKIAAWAVPWWVKALILIGGPVLLLGGAAWWHGGKVDDVFAAGELAERKRWQAARIELLELRRQRVEWSAARVAERLAALPRHVEKGNDRVQIHWKDRPERDCLDADSVRATEEARAIVRRAAAAGQHGNGL